MNIEELYKKVTVFRYLAPTTCQIMIDGVGFFDSNDFNTDFLPVSKSSAVQLVHYEPSTSIYQVVYTNGETVELTGDQIVNLQNSLNAILQDMDIPLPAYDPAKDNLFVGTFPLSEITTKNYVAAATMCTDPIAKYDPDTNTWNKVVAIILDDGSIILNPSGICERCTVFLTQTEWDTIPKTDEILADLAHYRYDIDANEWIEISSGISLLLEYRNDVHRLLLTKKYELTSQVDLFLPEFTNFNSCLKQLMESGTTEVASILSVIPFDHLLLEMSDTTLVTTTESELKTKATEHFNSTVQKLDKYKVQLMKYEQVVEFLYQLPLMLYKEEDLTKEIIANLKTVAQNTFQSIEN